MKFPLLLPFILIGIPLWSESPWATILRKSLEHDSQTLSAQLDSREALWNWENEQKSWIPTVQWNTPGLVSNKWEQGNPSDSSLWSTEAGAQISQKLWDGGSLALQSSQITAYEQTNRVWRQTPSVGGNVSQPLIDGSGQSWRDPEQGIANVQREIADEKYKAVVIQGLSQRIALVRDFDLAQADLETKLAQAEAAQAQREFQSKLTQQNRGSQIDGWKADRGARSAEESVLSARYRLLGLVDDLTITIGNPPPQVTNEDRQWLLSLGDPGDGPLREPADMLLARKAIEKLELERFQQRTKQAPVLSGSVSWSPDPTFQPFSKDWNSSWSDLSKKTTLWTLSFQLGLSFSPDLVGQDANLEKVHQAEKEKQTIVLRDLKDRRSQNITKLQSRIAQLEEYSALMETELKKDAQALGELETLFRRNDVSEVDFLTAKASSTALKGDALGVTWDLIVAKNDLAIAEGRFELP